MNIQNFKFSLFGKSVAVVLFAFLGLGVGAQAMADEGKRSCEMKLERLEEQRAYGVQYGNHDRVRDLDQAIDHLKRNCGDGVLMEQGADNNAEKAPDASRVGRGRSRGCERKLDNLYRQMEYAKQQNNQNRIRGLERAINNVERKCN